MDGRRRPGAAVSLHEDEARILIGTSKGARRGVPRVVVVERVGVQDEAGGERVETARVLDGLVAERLLHVVRQRPRARFRQPCANDWWAVRRRRTGHHDEQRSHAVYMLPRESLRAPPSAQSMQIVFSRRPLASGG